MSNDNQKLVINMPIEVYQLCENMAKLVELPISLWARSRLIECAHAERAKHAKLGLVAAPGVSDGSVRQTQAELNREAAAAARAVREARIVAREQAAQEAREARNERLAEKERLAQEARAEREARRLAKEAETLKRKRRRDDGEIREERMRLHLHIAKKSDAMHFPPMYPHDYVTGQPVWLPVIAKLPEEVGPTDYALCDEDAEYFKGTFHHTVVVENWEWRRIFFHTTGIKIPEGGEVVDGVGEPAPLSIWARIADVFRPKSVLVGQEHTWIKLMSTPGMQYMRYYFMDKLGFWQSCEGLYVPGASVMSDSNEALWELVDRHNEIAMNWLPETVENQRVLSIETMQYQPAW